MRGLLWRAPVRLGVVVHIGVSLLPPSLLSFLPFLFPVGCTVYIRGAVKRTPFDDPCVRPLHLARTSTGLSITDIVFLLSYILHWCQDLSPGLYPGIHDVEMCPSSRRHVYRPKGGLDPSFVS